MNRVKESVRNLRLPQIWYPVALALFVLLLYFCFSPMPPSPELDLPYSDKLYHFSYYTLMAFWYQQILEPKAKKTMFIAFVLLGIAIEIIQPLTGERFFEFLDMLANSLGTLCGQALALRVFPNLFVKIEQHYYAWLSQTPE